MIKYLNYMYYVERINIYTNWLKLLPPSQCGP